MSGQVVLTDLEMEVILKCCGVAHCYTRLSPEKHTALKRVGTKFLPHLNRKSRRRPRR